MDIFDYFANAIVPSKHVRELSKQSQLSIYSSLLILWFHAMKSPWQVQSWMKAAQEDFPDASITNQWHEGKVTCFCSGCKGRTFDVSATINAVLGA